MCFIRCFDVPSVFCNKEVAKMQWTLGVSYSYTEYNAIHMKDMVLKVAVKLIITAFLVLMRNCFVVV